MIKKPTTAWAEDAPAEAPPLAAAWQEAGEVRHTFTHFHLRLALRLAEPPAGATPARGAFVGRHVFRPSALPTVMRKVWAMAAPELGPL